VKLLARLLKLTTAEYRLLVSALFWLIACRIGLWVLSLQRIFAHLETFQTFDVSKTAYVLPERIAWAVRTVGRHLPGFRNCLVQSLAAQIMLMRRGYASQIRIGAARDNGEFKAHAWVECQGQIVLGAAGTSQNTPFPYWNVLHR